jgi:DNA mismatch repair protein MutH
MHSASSPPTSLAALIKRADALSGLTLSDIAQDLQLQIPDNLKKEKGWAGQVLEMALGAHAGSKPEQDFPDLGVELKTLPINHEGKPLETTYVCYAPLTQVHRIHWETSNVRNKLSHVLWVPILSDRAIPIAQRQVGTPFLWRPTAVQTQQLQQDWQDIMELIAIGKIEQVTAKYGNALQLRPKAADGSVLTDAIGQDGERIKTRPRGFYLRKSFTYEILSQQFSL